MINIFIWSIVFMVSLFVLIKSSDYFTTSAEKIGLIFGVPSFIIGVTIVAVGTSMPELITSLIAVFKGSSEIVIGNVIGSNITNIFLVLGIAAVVDKQIKITRRIIRVDLPFLAVSSFLLAMTVWDRSFHLPDALLLLGGLVLFVLYTIKESIVRKIITEPEKHIEKEKLKMSIIVTLLVSCVFIYLGAKITIESVINLADILHVRKEIIALSAVALGTSLPELVVSITAVRKGKSEMAVGNILGSNIFNTFAVMGIPALFGALVIPQSILTFALPVLLIATLLFYLICQDNKVTRWEGWLLLLFYIFFIGKTLAPIIKVSSG